ncbi:MAG: hypothetical protein N2V73_06145 [Candidatus Methanospirare jalkutatii]|nr:hypothetical protein [Candidatus Methanospirare jalkutatii]
MKRGITWLVLAFIVGSFSSIGAVNAYKVGVEWTNTYGFDYNGTDEALDPSWRFEQLRCAYSLREGWK